MEKSLCYSSPLGSTVYKKKKHSDCPGIPDQRSILGHFSGRKSGYISQLSVDMEKFGLKVFFQHSKWVQVRPVSFREDIIKDSPQKKVQWVYPQYKEFTGCFFWLSANLDTSPEPTFLQNLRLPGRHRSGAWWIKLFGPVGKFNSDFNGCLTTVVWVFPKIGCENPPKWIVKNNGRPLFFNGWFGGAKKTRFLETPILFCFPNWRSWGMLWDVVWCSKKVQNTIELQACSSTGILDQWTVTRTNSPGCRAKSNPLRQAYRPAIHDKLCLYNWILDWFLCWFASFLLTCTVVCVRMHTYLICMLMIDCNDHIHQKPTSYHLSMTGIPVNITTPKVSNWI